MLSSVAKFRQLFLLICLGLLATGAELECPNNCTCAHVNSRYTTDCSNRFLTEFPHDVSPKTMKLVMDNNPLHSAFGDRDIFIKFGLIHVVELSLKNCQIKELRRHSLRGLQNLRLLDLSQNQIEKLPKSLFKDMSYMTKLDLSQNRLKSVNWADFSGAGRLEELNLEGNRLDWIDPDNGRHLINLKSINLASNRFTTLRLDNFIHFPQLQSLLLIDNPWHCDCYLRPLVAWEKQKYLSDPPMCHQPEKLEGKKWNSLTEEEFACQPKMEANLADLNEPIPVALGTQFHLSCNAKGDPTPKIYWEFRSNQTKKIFDNSSNPSEKVRFLSRIDKESSTRRLSSLTVSHVNQNDAGQYHCVAENPAAKEYLVFNIRVTPASKGQAGDNPTWSSAKSPKTTDSASVDSILIILVSSGGLLILLVLVISIFCYRRKSLSACGAPQKPKVIFAAAQSNGNCKYTPVAGLNLDGPNPIGKPPRTQLGSAPSFTTPLYEAPLHIAALEKQHQRQFLLPEDLDYTADRCCALRDPAGSYMGTDDSGFLESDQTGGLHSPNNCHKINSHKGRSQVHFESFSPSSTPPEDPQSHQFDTIKRNGFRPSAPLARTEQEIDPTKGLLLRETEL